MFAMNLGAKFNKSTSMEVESARSDCIATGECNMSSPQSSNEWSKHIDGCSKLSNNLVFSFETWRLRNRDRELSGLFIVTYGAAESSEKFRHHRDICDICNIANSISSRRHQRNGHQFEHRVLRTSNHYIASEASAA